MKAYLISEAELYNTSLENSYELSPLSVEETIKKYAGQRTIMLKWENDQIPGSFICTHVHIHTKK